MCSQHAHGIAAARRFAFQFLVRGIEPVEETLQAGRVFGAIGKGRADQFIDRIIRLAPQPRDQLAPPVPRTGQQPVEQRLRMLVIDPRQQRAQAVGGRHAERRIAAADMVPQAHALVAQAMLQQVVLRPAAQRRDQQVGEHQVVARLRGEAQRGEQILDRQRRAQPQPVDACHRHARRVEPRNDQPGERAALAHQNHDVARAGPSLAALGQRVAVFEPRLHLRRDPVRHAALGSGQPGFRTVFLDRFGIVAFLGPDRCPQRHPPGPVFAGVLHLFARHPHRLRADMRHRAIDEIEDHLR